MVEGVVGFAEKLAVHLAGVEAGVVLAGNVLYQRNVDAAGG
jgi:hypothetical protein